MNRDGITSTPEPPYWTVVFTSTLRGDPEGYAAMADRMLALAAEQPGYLGVESARGEDGVGITVSYWRDREAVEGFGRVQAHRRAQDKGKSTWYESFALRVAMVEEQRCFDAD